MKKGSSSERLSGENDAVVVDTVYQTMQSVIGDVSDVQKREVEEALKDPNMKSLKERAKRSLGGVVGKIALPAQNYFKNVSVPLNEEQKNTFTYGFGEVQREVDFYLVKSGKNDLLTCRIDTTGKQDPKEKKYIIYFNGNGMHAQQTLPDMSDDISRLKMELDADFVTIGFDYPGVAQSTGKSKGRKDLVDAGYAQVQELIKQGVPPENIMLKGQSIGGGVATLVAAKLHQEGTPVYLFNQRSFSKLSNVIKSMPIPKVFSSLAARVVKSLSWEMDAVKAWNTIPDSYKGFCRAQHDEVIPEAASLGKGIGKTQENVIDNDHNNPISLSDWQRTFLPFVQNKFLSSNKQEKANDRAIQSMLNEITDFNERKPKEKKSRKGARPGILFTADPQGAAIYELGKMKGILEKLRGSPKQEVLVEAQSQLQAIKTQLAQNKEAEPLIKHLSTTLNKIDVGSAQDRKRRHTMYG